MNVATLRPPVERVHERLAVCWSDQTANPRSRPLPDGLPSSYGQCEVTSSVVFTELRRQFPDTLFQIAVGRVLTSAVGSLALKPVILGHVWLHYPRPKSAESIVIDGTAGQLLALRHELVVATTGELAVQGVSYQPNGFFNCVDELSHYLEQFPGTCFEERLALLSQAYEQR